MTNRDAASLLTILHAVAERLRQAPEVAKQQAELSGTNTDAFQVGYLASVLCGQADELERHAEEYLSRSAAQAGWKGKK